MIFLNFPFKFFKLFTLLYIITTSRNKDPQTLHVIRENIENTNLDVTFLSKLKKWQTFTMTG